MSHRIDADYRSVISSIGQIRALGIHRVRIAHDELTIGFNNDAHWLDQEPFGDDLLFAGIGIHVQHQPNSEVTIRRRYIGDINIVAVDLDRWRALELAALCDHRWLSGCLTDPRNSHWVSAIEDENVPIIRDRHADRCAERAGHRNSFDLVS